MLNGKVDLSLQMICKIAEALRVSEADLFTKKEEVNKAPAAQTRLPWLTMLIMAALCIVSIVLSVYIFDLRDQYVKLEESQNAILSRVDEQNAVIAGQANTISQLQTQLDASSGEQTEEDTQAQETEYARFVIYTVAQGDTLESICQANGVDYPTCKGMILGVNGIADADHIFVGQELLIPVYN